MSKFFSMGLGAGCLLSLAHLSPLAAQLHVDQQAAGGIANIYNLDRDARVGGVEIHGPIDKAVASQAIKLIRSIRPDIDELTVLLSSAGGDVLAAMELGEEVRKQWAWTAVDDERLNLEEREFASISRDRAKQNYTALMKSVETYLARMGMPKKLFQEISQQSSGRVLLLDARRLKMLGLEGTDPAYEQWLRANNYQQPPQSN